MNRISQIALMCACMVVLIHVPKEAVSSDRFMRLVPYGICSIALPCFFVVSGYFLGRRLNEERWWFRAVKKRIHTLLVPYLFWCGMMAVLPFPIRMAANIVAGRPLCANFFPHGWVNYLVDGFGLDLSSTPMLVAYWYIRALMLFFLISIAVKPLVMHYPRSTIVGLWVGGVILDCLVPSDGWLRGFITFGLPITTGLAYFTAGMALGGGAVAADPRLLDWRTRTVGLMAAIVVLVLYVLHCGGTWAGHLFRLLAVLMLWSIWPRREIAALSRIGWWGFAIFTLHPFVIYFGSFAQAYVNPSTPIQYLSYGAGCVVLSIAIGVVMRSALPRCSAIVFGGR